MDRFRPDSTNLRKRKFLIDTNQNNFKTFDDKKSSKIIPKSLGFKKTRTEPNDASNRTNFSLTIFE